MKLVEAVAALAALGPGGGSGRVLLERADGVAHLRLDHPQARSAVTFRMMRELAAAVVELQTFPGAAVVVSSTDPSAFCAGGHLGELLEHLRAPDRAEQMALAMAAVLDHLRDLPVPVFAVVHALAVGGGAELTTAADFRVFAPTAQVHFVHTRLGVVPGWGGTARLERLVGPTVALRWLTQGRPVDAREAHRVGFAEAPADDPMAAVLQRVDELRGREGAVRAAKAQLRADAAGQAAIFAARWGGADHRAALARRTR